jgi:hypothetical protein
MHPFGAWVIPCHDELLCIPLSESCLVIYLSERAREGSMAVFHIKATGETNVPVIVKFVDVGEEANLQVVLPHVSLHCVATAVLSHGQD